MARDHARILTSIWSDPEFRARSRDEQWLYFRVLSDKLINNCGVVPLFESKWARAAVGTSVEDVEKMRRGLVMSRFLVVDEETDEALVRSFLRNDRVFRQPNVLKNALTEAVATESPVLRHELAVELRRIATMLPGGAGFDGMTERVRQTAAALEIEGSPPPPNEPLRNPSGTLHGEPIGNPSKQPGSNPNASRGAGDGAGDGGMSSPGDRSLGGSRASAREAAPAHDPSASGGPPPRALPGLDEHAGWPEQPCGHHHDPDRDCRRCGRARVEARRADHLRSDQAVLDGLAERQARQAEAERRRACPACSETGWLEHPDTGTPVVRCDHGTDPRRQLADALDEAS